MKKIVACLVLLFAVALVHMSTLQAQTPAAADGVRYAADGKVIRPVNYREWAFVTSGIGMTYGPAQPAANRPPLFDNVFVNPTSYREFLRTGAWPDKTMFVLEIRRAEENVSINNGGRTQGEIVAMEAAVKDVQRFPDGGWGYFSFDSREGLVESANPLPSTATCYNCHRNNTAVENTFVQFYPTLMEVARKMGTVKTTYDPTKKP